MLGLRDGCELSWGSHGCHDPDARHTGDHWCIDEGETQPHSQVGHDGVDRETGFKWDLYGYDADGYAVGGTLGDGEEVTVWFRNNGENWQAIPTRFRIEENPSCQGS